eukprot:jgi/Ulvmu1/12498/UM009_0151.1
MNASDGIYNQEAALIGELADSVLHTVALLRNHDGCATDIPTLASLVLVKSKTSCTQAGLSQLVLPHLEVVDTDCHLFQTVHGHTNILTPRRVGNFVPTGVKHHLPTACNKLRWNKAALSRLPRSTAAISAANGSGRRT